MRAHRVSFLLTILSSLCLAACFGGHGGGGGGGNGGGGGGGGTNPTTVQFVSKPASVPAGSQVVFQAFTSHNKGNPLGVNWTLSPASGEGTLSNTVQGNPSSVTYTAPMTPCNNCVTITAQSVENPASTDSDTFSITAGSGNVSILFGQYAFLFSGFDANGAVAVAGSIHVDANGNVTGEEDFKDPTTLHTAAAILGSCQNLPVAATGFCKLTAGGKTSQYDFALRNNGVVARFFEDPGDGPSNTGSGVLIAQIVPSSGALTSAGGFNGYFSVEFVGTDNAGARIGVEGNIFTDLSATITPGANGSQADINDNGTLVQPTPPTATNVTGKMTGPVDANGRATAQMTVAGASSSQTLTLALYILAPEVPTSNQSGRAFAIDITPTATSTQVLSGQFSWLGPPPLNLTFDNTDFPVNVFALWGVTPGAPASSSTQIGTFNGVTGQLLFDSNDASQFNGGKPGPQTGTIGTSISVSPNGRAILSATVGGTTSTYILYLDLPSDGNMLGATVGTGNDTKVSFGFFTGQGATGSFNNTKISGNYVIGTTMPVLAAVPNGAAPMTLTPTVPDSGMFSVEAGAVTGNYLFDASTGRGTATASSGKIFQSGSAVFYIITPKLMLLMGADQGIAEDAIALIQF